MKLNKTTTALRTHEGAKAKHINSTLQLRRSVMACMLWEGEFYESGETIASRISALIKLVAPEKVAEIAIEAREKMKLRHVPLLIVRELARLKVKTPSLIGDTLARVIQRADELSEFLAIYWKDKRQPLSKQVKRGLALAFEKFDEYQLAKYNRADAIKLRDVLFVAHVKPKGGVKGYTKEARKAGAARPTDEGSQLLGKLVDGTLSTPDTWEVELSAKGGENKLESWQRLLSENKLGALALLRNLRNMKAAGIPESDMRAALLKMKAERVLPYRFIAAARYAPNLEPELEQAMFKCLTEKEKLPGETMLLVDVSGSMDAPISSKSDLQRVDAACGLAMMVREMCESVQVVSFSDFAQVIPARRGFALRDAIVTSQSHSGTNLGRAVTEAMARVSDRLIVITDEQAHDRVPDADRKAYMINVASAQNGVGYGSWMHIDGWSEAVLDYIVQFEKSEADQASE